MTKSGFAQLHHTLLHRVFSCTSLSFVDKVRSEQVCTARRAYLSASISQSSRDVWSDQLVVLVSSAAIHVRMVQLAEKVLSSPSSYLFSEQKSFVEWLVKRAARFRKVHFTSAGDRGYRAVSLLLALYNSVRSNSFGPELELHTGNCTIPSGLLTSKSHLAIDTTAPIQFFTFMQEAIFCWKHLPHVSS